MQAMDTELTDAQWQIADAIARQLVLDGTDVNELRKAIAYLRTIVNQKNGGKQFFDYLQTLVRHGRSVGHSKKTAEYYRSLDIICGERLGDYQDDAPKMLLLLGWAARLVKYYYRESMPIGELKVEDIKSEREIELEAVVAENTFEVGQILEASITAIKKNKVTYEILGAIKLTQSEHKLLRSNSLSRGKVLKVRIKTLRDNGSIKKVQAII